MKRKSIVAAFLITAVFVMQIAGTLLVVEARTSSFTESVHGSTRLTYEENEFGETIIRQYEAGILIAVVTVPVDRNQPIRTHYRTQDGSFEDKLTYTDARNGENFSGFTLRQSPYSKLGDVHCIRSDGYEFDIGYYYKTLSIGDQRLYNPVAGESYLISAFIGILEQSLEIPPVTAEDFLYNLIVRAGTAVLESAFVRILSSQSLLCNKYEYAVKLNRYYDEAVADRYGTTYLGRQNGILRQFDHGFVPVKNQNQGYMAKEAFFPLGGATFLNWN